MIGGLPCEGFSTRSPAPHSPELQKTARRISPGLGLCILTLRAPRALMVWIVTGGAAGGRIRAAAITTIGARLVLGRDARRPPPAAKRRVLLEAVAVAVLLLECRRQRVPGSGRLSRLTLSPRRVHRAVRFHL